MPPHGERLWIARDGHRYRVRILPGVRYVAFESLDSDWTGAAPVADDCNMIGLDSEELETLLQDARGRG
jgi:hypothetical protein